MKVTISTRPWLGNIAWITAILSVWFIIITYLHHYIHVHLDLIATFLFRPWLQLAAAVLLVAVLVYLIILSMPGLRNPSLRGFVTLFAWVALIVCGHALTHIGTAETEMYFSSIQSHLGITGILLMAIVYALLLAVPFVAGVEIGLLMMAVFGVTGVFIAYAGTIVGISLAFWSGRLLPESLIADVLRKFRLKWQTQDLDNLLAQQVGNGWATSVFSRLLDHRYLTLAVLLNCPGNVVLGGGGGLALLSGISRSIKWRKFFTMIVIATTPVPLLVLLGLFNIDTFMEHTGILHDFLTLAKTWLP
jgi:hypothetical protein